MGKRRPQCDIREWGPNAWQFFHCVSLTYPKKPTADDKKRYKTFFTSLGDVLPCHDCRNNYKKKLKKIPLSDAVLSSQKGLFEWLVDVHNEVNAATHKRKYTYNEVFKQQMTWHEDNRTTSFSTSKTAELCFSVVAFAIIIWAIVKWMHQKKK